ncbi:unnamed protein product [Arabidopsis lyrata]|uniref:Predicted protein n=1 Tax=Arabidopsis lyrata subsp. lyrata TaxID=81972 RepID=D7LE19_ARALL|nr:predicted protein [Arabidopsis lyrata subsp. lyrata]CAH8263122.1 unnamed protein product [Arabidopsis lyrata]
MSKIDAIIAPVQAPVQGNGTAITSISPSHWNSSTGPAFSLALLNDKAFSLALLNDMFKQFRSISALTRQERLKLYEVKYGEWNEREVGTIFC